MSRLNQDPQTRTLVVWRVLDGAKRVAMPSYENLSPDQR
jgi:hypothetical protein